MVKSPGDILKEVYVRKMSNQKMTIPFNTAMFRDTLITLMFKSLLGPGRCDQLLTVIFVVEKVTLKQQ